MTERNPATATRPTPDELAELRALAAKVAGKATGAILTLATDDETTKALRTLAERLPTRKDH